MSKFVRVYRSDEGERFIRTDSIREIRTSDESNRRGHVHVVAFTDDHCKTDDGRWVGTPLIIGWSLATPQELSDFLSELGVVNP